MAPALVLIMSEEDDGTAGEGAPNHVPTLVTVQMGLVESDRAGPGHVRVDGHAHGAVGRARAPHYPGVRAHRIRAAQGIGWSRLGDFTLSRDPHALSLGEKLLELLVHVVEERRLEGHPRDDILAGHGKIDVRHFITVQCGEMRDTRRVAFRERAGLRAHIALVPRFDEVPDTQHLHKEIELGMVPPIDCGGHAAHHQHTLFYMLPVVLALGESQAVGSVGIALAEDVRYAPFVPENPHVVAARCGDVLREILGRRKGFAARENKNPHDEDGAGDGESVPGHPAPTNYKPHKRQSPS